MFEHAWIRPALILGTVAILVTLNVLEFRGKRRRDAEEWGGLPEGGRPELWLARKQYLQTQNIEQVLHIIGTVLIAILIAVLSA